MFYTLEEAAKATGLESSIILKAIQDGQIFGMRDQYGEWQIEDVEIHRLYLLVAQHYCKQKYRAGLRTDAGTTSEAQLAASTSDNDAGGLQQHIDSLGESPDGADQAKATPTTASTWDNEIRIDNRDKISISESRLGGYQTRITRIAFLALGCIAALSSYYFLGQSLISEQKVNSSAPSLEREVISKSPPEQHSALETVGKTPAIANAIDQPQEGTQASQAPAPTTPVTKRDAAAQQTAPKKSEVRPQVKLAPVPETRPTTIRGWTVQSVVDGTAVLEGPNGIWKVARGDMVPGLGRVESIVLWGSRWIVATSKGLISTR
jgi:hypothetical protein